MGWSIGWDSRWKRDIGYGVPAYCDQPKCCKKIDRGLGYVCGGDPYGGEHGCGLFFCSKHRFMGEHAQVCKRCLDDKPWFKAKPDHPEWIEWKLTDESWEEWRQENPEIVKRMTKMRNIYYLSPKEFKKFEMILNGPAVWRKRLHKLLMEKGVFDDPSD